MTRLRLYCAALIAWLFVFFNVERLHAPINLASFVYVMAAVSALAVILVPYLQKQSLVGLLAVLLSATLGLKWLWGYPLFGTSLPITVTELGAVTLTVLLAYQFGGALQEFREAVAALQRLLWADRSAPFETGQADMFREVRRARLYQRPLSLMAIQMTEESEKIAVNRLLEEMQRKTFHHYTMARMADVISAQLDQCAIVTFRDNQFVTLLPETGAQQASEVAHQLESAVRETLGLELRVGISTFPDEEITFVDLLRKAESALATPTIPCNGEDRRACRGDDAQADNGPLEFENARSPSNNGKEKHTERAVTARVPE